MNLSHLTPEDARIDRIVRMSSDHLREAQDLVTRAHALEVQAAMCITPQLATAKRALAASCRDRARELSHDALVMQLEGSVRDV